MRNAQHQHDTQQGYDHDQLQQGKAVALSVVRGSLSVALSQFFLKGFGTHYF